MKRTGIKNRLGRAACIAAAAAVISGLAPAGVASAGTAQPAAVTSVTHHAWPATAGQAAARCRYWYGWGWYYALGYHWFLGWHCGPYSLHPGCTCP